MKALALAVVVTGLVAVAGCNNNGGRRSGALTTSERKYCELVKQFKSHMPTVSKDADPQEFTAELSASMARSSTYFEDLLKVAPAEIKPDVEEAIAALRRVATGDITAYEGLDLTRADQWEEDHCTRA
jgi:O6-methylguanine-DNA--protein-cysteine methyltransferase